MFLSNQLDSQILARFLCLQPLKSWDRNFDFYQQKIEYSALTPNLQQRVSIKENSQSYSFTFKKDLNIESGKIEDQTKLKTSQVTSESEISSAASVDAEDEPKIENSSETPE